MVVQLPAAVRRQVEKGIDILKRGGVIAFPTDTVYGMGAGMAFHEAVERIYRLKGRPRGTALPLLLADVSQISEYASYVPPVAWTLAKKFLPGALTLVLLKADSVPDYVTAGGRTVALRVSAHPVPQALARGVGMPIIGTSANLSGKPSPVTAADVCEQFGDKIDLVIDGGRSPGGKESTIVDVSGDKVVLLREGAISRKELELVCEIA